eukprot:CAMPEP_0117522418 /NCGR_PEP_ID=MMETSP0784-20121206/34196_1 /TAXON_ID=39447 /ORGANISM="" /LENGTH=156 /DNA_ID=CAMNT_0005318487 /DNA_START=210 /DNA_END=680 /DNA_ORIENTATION=-
MTLVCLGAAYTFAKASCDNPKMFCLIQIVLAAIHAIFALYIQRRLCNAVGKDVYSRMTFSEVAAKTTEIMMYDIGFCVYVMVFAGAFFYTCYGLSGLGDCSGTGPAWSSAALHVIYIFGVFHYALCWYFCQSCCGAGESAVAQLTGSKPQKVGASG